MAIGANPARRLACTETLSLGKKEVVRLEWADITTVPAKPLTLAKMNCV
jgi:hypothetical protein